MVLGCEVCREFEVGVESWEKWSGNGEFYKWDGKPAEAKSRVVGVKAR